MDYPVRLLVGRAVVSLFAIVAEVLRPKSFAGLFSAAPSVALPSLRSRSEGMAVLTLRLKGDRWPWAVLRSRFKVF